MRRSRKGCASDGVMVVLFVAGWLALCWPLITLTEGGAGGAMAYLFGVGGVLTLLVAFGTRTCGKNPPRDG